MSALDHLEERWRRRRELLVLGALLAVTTALILARPWPRVLKSQHDLDLERLERERR